MISQFTKPKKKLDHPNYVPYPMLRPGPVQDGRKTEIDQDVKIREFNYASKTLNKPIDWTKIIALGVSDSLYSGTIFVETDQGALIVRGYDYVGQGYFQSQLALVLQIPVPQKRIIRWDDIEYKMMAKELQRATFIYKELHKKIINRLERPFIEIQEYIPGISLSLMGTARAAKIFNYYDPPSRHRMIKVGFVMAFDIFLNNSNRYPLEIWKNSGNAEHMIARTDPKYTDTTRDLRDIDNLSFEFEYIYALDSYTYERSPNYYSRVEEFLNKLFLEMKSVMQAQLDPLYESKDQKIECLNEFKQMIYDHTLYEIKEMSLLQILFGIILTLDNLITMGYERIETVLESVEIEEDWKQSWTNNLKSLNMPYYETMLQIFRKFCDIYQDVVRYCKEITLNQYQFDEEKYYQIVMMNPKIRDKINKQRENDLMNDNVIPLTKSEGDESEVMERDLNDEELDKKIEDMFMLDKQDIPKPQTPSNHSQLSIKSQQEEQFQTKQLYGGLLAKKYLNNQNFDQSQSQSQSQN